MSDEERAAKAARAKAMLNKRRQQQAKKAPNAIATDNALESTPGSPLTRAANLATPPPAEMFGAGISDAGDLFGKPNDTQDGANWLNSLERVGSPSQRPHISPPSRRGSSASHSPVLDNIVAPQPQSPVKLSHISAFSLPPPAHAGTNGDTTSDLQLRNHSPQATGPSSTSDRQDEKIPSTKEIQRLREEIEASYLVRMQTLESELAQAQVRLLEDRQADDSLNARIGVLEKEGQSLALQLAEHATNEETMMKDLSEARAELDELRSQNSSHRQAISLLVSEKAELTSFLEASYSVTSNLKETEVSLETERSHVVQLQEEVGQLRAAAAAASQQVTELSAKDKETRERLRDLERELQLNRSELGEVKPLLEHHRQRVTELEEQIQNDDSVDRLEKSLANTQARADDLEFQLSKARQAAEKLRGEHGELAAELEQRKAKEATLLTQTVQLQQMHAQVQATLASIKVERDSHEERALALQSELVASRDRASRLQEELSRATSDLETTTEQHKVAQTELKIAHRRVDEAQKLQKDVQSEGSALMKSLEEARMKVTELTGTQSDLQQRISRLETDLKRRDAVITELESSSEELRHKLEVDGGEHQDALSALQKEHEKGRRALEQTNAELLKGYSEVQAQLQSLQGTVNDLQVERTSQRQALNEGEQRFSRLTNDLRSRTLELQAVQSELEERRQAYEEDQQVLAQTQADLESARLELASKEDEISGLLERTQQRPKNRSISLNDEMASVLTQEHSFELSEAHSEIRQLKTSLFDAEAKAHTLQKEVQDLQDELSQLHTVVPSRNDTSVSITPVSVPSRPSTRGLNRPDSTRIPSGSQRHPGGSAASQSASRTLLDQSLSPSTWHKRRVSLGMLKARIDSEISASRLLSRPRSPTTRGATGLPPVLESPESPSVIIHTSTYSHIPVRPQFLDESHVFWCHCCEGDLFTL